MRLHPHASTVKDHTFRFQAKSLFERRFPAQEDFAFCAHYAMPRQAARILQCPHNLARRTGEAGRARDITVGGDFAFWDAANGIADDVKHRS